jgi:hypothetical protein
VRLKIWADKRKPIYVTVDDVHKHNVQYVFVEGGVAGLVANGREDTSVEKGRERECGK